MDETSRLKAAMVPPGTGADLIARNIGGLVRLEPLTQRAAQWLHRAASAEAGWDGSALVI